MLLSAEKAAAGLVRVYRGATVIDGTGATRYVADVAVEGKRVVAIIPEGASEPVLALPDGAVEIRADGLVLAPGFIDMHAHSELAVLSGAAHDAKIRQGVTTEVLGQDGLGYAPSTMRRPRSSPRRSPDGTAYPPRCHGGRWTICSRRSTPQRSRTPPSSCRRGTCG